MNAIGRFSWKWPAATETFETGWVARVELNDQEFHVRHGIGRRAAYGRNRLRSVTWIENQPMVEGVEADDFPRSHCLMSLIKVTKRHLRWADRVPAGYRGLQLALMSDEIAAPYSPRSLAVKLRQDDIAGWARHAVLRATAWGVVPRVRERIALPASTSAGPAPAAGPSPAPNEQRQRIAKALLEFGGGYKPGSLGPVLEFTPVPAANELIRTNGFAFLLAVLMDQGVPAERAWLAPYELLQRLAHLDPARFAVEEDAIRAAVQQRPKLHRYVETIPRWLSLAGRRVMSQYDGIASRIWSDRPAADVLQRRFDAFVGIAQKKAAMAVEILERDLGVKISKLDRSDVAYDIHLRRVFLRTRLADRDDRDHMIGVARALHPERPGQLDLPAWLVGRAWCRPGIPNCAGCVLTNVCPKDIERAAGVRSA
jgi:uncharacterized HhH-GPD family protein